MGGPSLSSPHPLAPLSIAETDTARDVILASHPDTVIDFRIISLQEPAKNELNSFLDLEHSQKLLADSPRPRRLAKVHYDVIGGAKVPKYCESVVDIEKNERIEHQVVATDVQASLTV